MIAQVLKRVLSHRGSLVYTIPEIQGHWNSARYPWLSATILATTAAVTISATVQTTNSGTYCEKDPVFAPSFDAANKADMLSYLKSQLDIARDKRSDQVSPKVSVLQEGDTFIFRFRLHPLSSPTETVLSFVLGMNEPEYSIPCLSPNNGESPIDRTTARVTFQGSGQHNGSICLFSPAPRSTEFIMYKDGTLSKDEISRFVKAYDRGTTPANGDAEMGPRTNVDMGSLPELFRFFDGSKLPSQEGGSNAVVKGTPLQKLQALGATVHNSEPSDKTTSKLDWDSLAGYDKVKQDINDTIIMVLQHPQVFEDIAKKTRVKLEYNRTKSVLFEGPPGTGKTTAARIIACQSGVPLVYVPVESIMSKWFGESENQLSQIFDACDELGDCIIFLDEIDALATDRSAGNMHEATRRILSVLLRKIEGFDSQNRKSIVIGATNRKADLDAALLSRFDVSIFFGLPEQDSRKAIFAQYAKQLSESTLEKLAEQSSGLSGRDIKDVCMLAERRWASETIRENESNPQSGKVSITSTPSEEHYLKSLRRRLQHIHGTESSNIGLEM